MLAGIYLPILKGEGNVYKNIKAKQAELAVSQMKRESNPHLAVWLIITQPTHYRSHKTYQNLQVYHSVTVYSRHFFQQ